MRKVLSGFFDNIYSRVLKATIFFWGHCPQKNRAPSVFLNPPPIIMSPPRSETWNFLSMGTSVVSTISISLTLKEVFILNPDTPVVALVIFHLLCAFLLTSSLWVVGYYKLPQEIPWGYVSLLGVVQVCFCFVLFCFVLFCFFVFLFFSFLFFSFLFFSFLFFSFLFSSLPLILLLFFSSSSLLSSFLPFPHPTPPPPGLRYHNGKRKPRTQLNRLLPNL